MLAFLQAVYKALEKDQQSEIVHLYTDFSKAFDKISQYFLLSKVDNLGVSGCLFELLHEYLSNQMQVMRFYNVSSRPENVTSDVPQLSLLGPHLFCIFFNNAQEALAFCDSFFLQMTLDFCP